MKKNRQNVQECALKDIQSCVYVRIFWGEELGNLGNTQLYIFRPFEAQFEDVSHDWIYYTL